MKPMSRRQALLTTAALGALAARPVWASEARVSLPIPPERRPNAQGVIAFDARSASRRFLPDRNTPTYGYDGAFLGPALRLRRGEAVTIDFTNRLPEPTTVHWHGLIIPGDVDGGPHRPVAPGGRWRPTLPIDQPAATLWFHPHFYPTTAAQVIKGLAGLLIIDDEETDRLALPSRWGIDDIPLGHPGPPLPQRRRLLRCDEHHHGDQRLCRHPAAGQRRGISRGAHRARLGAAARARRVQCPQLPAASLGRSVALRHRLRRRAAGAPGGGERTHAACGRALRTDGGFAAPASRSTWSRCPRARPSCSCRPSMRRCGC